MKTLIAFFLAACCAAASAQTPQPPEVAARQYILLDLNSNQVLAEREADVPGEPASLTKLMTAYLVFNAIRDKKLGLEQTLTVSRRAWDERRAGGSLMFIDTTMTPKVSELLRGLIVQSGNDAAIVLAEGVAGSVETFVEAMNRQAKAWGLKNTQFKNVAGLTEPGHHMSARDVAMVAAHIITEHPDFYPIYSMRQYSFNNIKQDNRNLLLGRDPSVDGMKTGYTEAAGYCLVASSARETPAGKRRLISVVMGTASREARAAESLKLLNWGWQAWDAVRLFEAGKPVVTVPVWKGAQPEAKLGAPGALYVTVPKGEGDKLKTTVERTDPLLAPLIAAQQVGAIKITTAAGTPVATVPLVVLEPVPLAGLFGRAWDSIRLWIK
ncbi:D-alanyl-D-alanine carboxypeptidase DacA [Rubrivivax sp. A210]|uniref:D-alanyl-D-alanine carboxypeptidase family protein n=1 Tax=Rubrivivax sp. A210 TaxID=2772301 RepID=UPI00191A7A6E|nr:D-alanyl-D-alanine carboxypeptidase family protein [Rubrivivax sp. A210]CAD5374635.1 D-alanyl-D-alanine carboxypeptidase DacA [Rubrivivax sp. A210]